MHSSMCPTVHGLGFVHCGQIAWKKWPTNWHAHVSRWLMLSCHWQLWVLLPMSNHFGFFFFFAFFFLRLGLGQRRAVVIIGRWLLPSLVDTGDICCHYWQHILVTMLHHNIQENAPDEFYFVLITSYALCSTFFRPHRWHSWSRRSHGPSTHTGNETRQSHRSQVQ